MGRGCYKTGGGGGDVKFYRYEKGGGDGNSFRKSFSFGVVFTQ